MSDLQSVLGAFSGQGMDVHALLNAATVIGLPWCVLTLIGGGTIFRFLFGRH
ncbi:MAG TPA: hypothetical protein VMB71_02445 [Acetobacteraceae bacterium]|nr:hypothetical protein [Acetobacteraceae bacterium]